MATWVKHTNPGETPTTVDSGEEKRKGGQRLQQNLDIEDVPLPLVDVGLQGGRSPGGGGRPTSERIWMNT